MKLLIVSSWWPYPLDNGSRVRAYHLICRLAARHEVTLISFGLPGGGEQKAPLEACCARVEVIPPVSIGSEGLGLKGLISWLPRYIAQTDNARMRERLAKLAPEHDAAIALQIYTARYLAEIPSLPRVFDEVEVNVLREQYVRANSLGARLRHGLTWWKFSAYLKAIVRAMDRATVVSEAERELLVAMGCDGARLDVVPNGVDVPPLQSSPVRMRRLIYPGAVTYSANWDAVRYFVREVFPLIRTTHPDVEFWVTGATDGVSVRELVQPGVKFTGRLPSVDDLIAQSAVCVVPLRIGGGTRLKILQSMALGTPVVSTSKGAEGLDIDAGRHLLIADNPRAFANAVDRLLGDETIGARLRTDAWALVRSRYDWGLIWSTLDASLARAVAARRDSLSHALADVQSAIDQ